MKSAYDVLGLAPGADDDAVHGAYRRMAKALHPDVNKRPTATTEFKEVQKAYNTLKDPDKRREHEYALAKVETAGIEDDAIDAALETYGIDVPKKKKKKKKKKVVEVVQHSQPQPTPYYQAPQYIPPQPYAYDQRQGRGEFEGIPDGFDDNGNLGGIV